MIAENIVHFARVLRRAGLPVGPDRVLAAIEAVEVVGLTRRDDVHAALSAVMLGRREQQVLFDAAFAAFWRDPKLLEQLMYLLLPKVSGRGEKHRPTRSNRLAEALAAQREAAQAREEQKAAPDEITFETTFTFSERERLQTLDFETMTTAEFDAAKRLAERAPLPVRPVRQRRHARAASGTIDLSATLRQMARQPETLLLRHTRPREVLPPLVVLLDVSGSMDRYARLFLHYAHGLTRRHLRVHTFTVGTRLTNITRCLAHRDDGGRLAEAAARLHRLAHEVIWLNPLLRFDGFEPRAAGVRALLPHVDRVLPMHNLNRLADLGRALRQPARLQDQDISLQGTPPWNSKANA